MTQIGFKAKIIAPYFTEPPPEIGENWVKKMKEARGKTYQGIKKAIKTRKDFKEKIAEPIAKGIASFTDPNFVSRSGRTYRNIMDKARDSLSRAGKHYLRRVTDAYQPGRYEGKVEDGRKEYARRWREITGPLRGHKKGGIKGLAALGVMALCGDPRIKEFLKERMDVIEGQSGPALTGTGFKLLLTNRIVRWGSEIIELGYEDQDIRNANEKLNQLVNEYRRPEITPFSPSGDSSRNNRDSAHASHIDFIVVEIPNPAKAVEKVKCLGLDIQIAFQ